MFYALQTWAEAMKLVAESFETADPFLHHSFQAGSKQPFCGYGPNNVQFLQEVSAKCDSTSIFQILVPGGFTVAKVC